MYYLHIYIFKQIILLGFFAQIFSSCIRYVFSGGKRSLINGVDLK